MSESELESLQNDADYQLPLMAKVLVFVIPLWVINAYALRLGYWLVGVTLSVLVVTIMVWQWARIERSVIKLRHKAVDEYHVKPGLFVTLYALSFVPFYIGLFVMAEGAVRHSWILVGVGGLVNRLAFAMPYLYPIFWGTLPKKLKVLVWAWITISVAFFAITKVLS